jgi:hypothetical protein
MTDSEKDALILRQQHEIQILKNARDDRTEALFRERMAEAKVVQTNVQFIAMKSLLKQYLAECESPVPDLLYRTNLRKRLATLLAQCEAGA